MLLRLVRWTSVAALACIAPVVHAQSGTPAVAPGVASGVAQAPAPQDSVHRNLLLVNPIGVVFNIYNGEFEHVTARAFTVGVGGTYYKDGDFGYTTAEAKFRYYPQERAPHGFSVAMSGGVTHVSGDFLCWDVCSRQSHQYPTLGVELNYNWLIGPSQRFVIGAGGGAKRLYRSVDDGTSTVLPTIRLSIGGAF